MSDSLGDLAFDALRVWRIRFRQSWVDIPCRSCALLPRSSRSLTSGHPFAPCTKRPRSKGEALPYFGNAID